MKTDLLYCSLMYNIIYTLCIIGTNYDMLVSVLIVFFNSFCYHSGHAGVTLMGFLACTVYLEYNYHGL